MLTLQNRNTNDAQVKNYLDYDFTMQINFWRVKLRTARGIKMRLCVKLCRLGYHILI